MKKGSKTTALGEQRTLPRVVRDDSSAAVLMTGRGSVAKKSSKSKEHSVEDIQLYETQLGDNTRRVRVSHCNHAVRTLWLFVNCTGASQTLEASSLKNLALRGATKNSIDYNMSTYYVVLDKPM